ncbi:uncharacterized protein METZ01_LOCUS387308, partial [marine metagenome]
FTITVTDSDSTETDTMTVTITVTGANDAPSAGSDGTGAATEDASTSTATGSITATDDDDAAAFTYSGDATGTYGAIAVDSAGAWTYTLDNSDADTDALGHDGSGTDTFTLTVSDGTDSDTMDVVITVSGANDAPTVATAIADASTDEDAAYSLDISSNFADVDTGDGVTYAATGMPSTLTMSTAGVLSGTPVNDDVAVHTIVVTATDDGATPGASVTDTFDLTVVNTDDATQGSVTVSGDTYDDEVLTSDTSLLTDDDGMGTFAYQWATQDGDVSGATSSTYTIPSCESTAV